jgi:NAD(P)-dependent dehydrogenase (short-subunit alcohol dehydrogenase family)
VSELRSVVITGASRGLGRASAKHLYEQGWQVVAAMRSVDKGMAALREETGASADDPRLIGVRLDLLDPESIATAAAEIIEAVGAPFAVVHNAGIAAAGTAEELPAELWHDMFWTHVFGPVELTKALLPSMRAAGRGRIVMISSAGGVRGMPVISAYSAAKGAAERYAESLAGEISPFGLGVSVIVTGVFDTDIITDAGTPSYRDFEGPYGRQHVAVDKRGRAAMKLANDPARFAPSLAKALNDRGPYARHAVGPDALGLMVMARMLPSKAVHQVIRVAMGIPRHGAMGSGKSGSRS